MRYLIRPVGAEPFPDGMNLAGIDAGQDHQLLDGLIVLGLDDGAGIGNGDLDKRDDKGQKDSVCRSASGAAVALDPEGNAFTGVCMELSCVGSVFGKTA